MNKKKILVLAMSLAMVAILAIGGTIAYFTDTDKAANTFELGGVDITLIEKKYENGAWTEIEDPDGEAALGQLNPVDEDDWAKVTEAGYAYNKTVFTMNNEDEAYIRNYVAVEAAGNKEDGEPIYYTWYLDADTNQASEASYRHGAVLTETFEGVLINEKPYDIYVYDTVGNKPVATGNSFVTLTTVVLKDIATNEDIEKLGETFEVYTFSEAIQSSGLTHTEAMTALIGDDATLEAHATRVMSELITK